MESLFEQIEKGLSANLYYLSLFVALCIPDICGALESENGEAHKDKYLKWNKEYLINVRPEKYGNQLSAEHIYYFRCAILHQGRTKHDSKIEYKRILFIEPGIKTGIDSIHCCIVGSSGQDKSLLINLTQFCADIINGAKTWLNNNANNQNYLKNYEKLIKRYPNGISPVFGCPIIG
jgi:hypothetical protein